MYSRDATVSNDVKPQSLTSSEGAKPSLILFSPALLCTHHLVSPDSSDFRLLSSVFSPVDLPRLLTSLIVSVTDI